MTSLAAWMIWVGLAFAVVLGAVCAAFWLGATFSALHLGRRADRLAGASADGCSVGEWERRCQASLRASRRRRGLE